MSEALTIEPTVNAQDRADTGPDVLRARTPELAEPPTIPEIVAAMDAGLINIDQEWATLAAVNPEAAQHATEASYAKTNHSGIDTENKSYAE